MTAIRVENSHPVPNDYRGNRIKYPFAKMQPGHSFAVPIGSETVDRIRKRIHKSLSGQRQHRNIQGEFITRQVGKELRCWRVR